MTILNATMWRTGSTYLANVFAKSGSYFVYYEPFHEYISKHRWIVWERERRGENSRRMNHPDFGTGYFDNFVYTDPHDNVLLYRKYANSSCMRDVYNEASEKTLHFLEAAERVAEFHGKTAFLGITRSGTQIDRIQSALGYQKFHLWRDARSQFASYDWPKNDYFMPITLIQLLLAKPLHNEVDQIAPQLRKRAILSGLWLTTDAMHGSRIRIGRRLARGLSFTELYGLFYLSWLISYRSGKAGATYSLSLSEMNNDSNVQKELEERYGLNLSDLRATPRISEMQFDAKGTEQFIERIIG